MSTGHPCLSVQILLARIQKAHQGGGLIEFMVGEAGFEPATNRLCVPLQLSLPLSSLRSGLSLHPRGMPAVQSLHLVARATLARDYLVC